MSWIVKFYKFISQHRSSNKGLHVTNLSGTSSDNEIADCFDHNFQSVLTADDGRTPALPHSPRIEYPHEDMVVDIKGVTKLFDDQGHCLDAGVEKRIRKAATSLIDYIHNHICPKIALEEMVRNNTPD